MGEAEGRKHRRGDGNLAGGTKQTEEKKSKEEGTNKREECNILRVKEQIKREERPIKSNELKRGSWNFSTSRLCSPNFQMLPSELPGGVIQLSKLICLTFMRRCLSDGSCQRSKVHFFNLQVVVRYRPRVWHRAPSEKAAPPGKTNFQK